MATVAETLEPLLRQARAEGFAAAISAAESRVHYLTARDELSGHIKALTDVGADHGINKMMALRAAAAKAREVQS